MGNNEKQQVQSLKKGKKNWKIFCVAGILAALFVGGIVCAGLMMALRFDGLHSKVKVYMDTENYRKYIGPDSVAEFGEKWGMDETIFPERITENMDVNEFKFVYYNPWDAQYVSYLTVEYTEEDYKEELARLGEKGMENYAGYYGVTGEPEGYELLAMDSDAYQGFVYAMTPGGDERTITYVEIIFCNYFLDLDIRDHVPEKYLLSGFDAGEDNPYRKEMMKGA